MLLTRGGALRSGDLHACWQMNYAVFGRVGLRLLCREGERRLALGAGEALAIPPFVPHLYDFRWGEALMTEAWQDARGRPCAFEAWHYAPYRDLLS